MKRFNAILAGAAMIAGAQFAAGAAQAAALVTCTNATCAYSSVDMVGSGTAKALTKGTVAKPTTATSTFNIVLPSAGTFEISFTPSGSGTGGTGLTFTKLVFGSTTINNPLSGELYDFTVAGPGTYSFAITAKNTANKSIGFTTSYSFAAVPEPAAWGLMIGGFAMAGASVRRRRNVRVAIA